LAHNTSGLPPLNLEPFDPSDLYAAARSNSNAPTTGRRPRVNPVLVGLGTLVALVAVVATALLT
jgi:hypothetical protein